MIDPRHPGRALCAAVVLGAWALVGCASSDSFSESSESISKSLKSPFESSSNSSGGHDLAYRGDVEAYAAAWAADRSAAPTQTEDFVRGLGRVAEAHGVTDWEALDATYLAVGTGLRRSGVPESEVGAFGRRWFGDDARAAHLLLEGWRSAEDVS